MSRPYIKYVQCDGCDARFEQPNGPGYGSGWVPPFWSEIFIAGSNESNSTKHACSTCTIKVLNAIEKPKVQTKSVTMVYADRGEVKKNLVLVHADGGECHGTALLNGLCPLCGIVPDMQSTEFWDPEKVR